MLIHTWTHSTILFLFAIKTAFSGGDFIIPIEEDVPSTSSRQVYMADQVIVEVGESSEEDPVPQIDHNDSRRKRTLKLECARALDDKWGDGTLRNLFFFVDIAGDDYRNWEEFTRLMGCREAFAKRCGVLSPQHLKKVLEEERWINSKGEDYGTAKDRLQTLFDLDCLQKIRHFEVLQFKDIDFLPEGLELARLPHWASFQPEVLAALMDKQRVYTNLPTPSRHLIPGIKRIIEAPPFMDGSKPYWHVLDTFTIGLCAKQYGYLTLAMHRALISIGGSLPQTDALSIIQWLLRSEAFVQFVIHEKTHSADLVELILTEHARLRATFSSISGTNNDEIVKRVAYNLGPDTRNALTAAVKAKEEYRAAAEAFLALEGTRSRREIRPSPLTLSDFARLMATYDEVARSSWLAEYALLYGMHMDDIKLAKEILLKTATSLADFFHSPEYMTGHSLLPLTPFHIFTAILQGDNSEILKESSDIINNAIGMDRERRDKIVGQLSQSDNLKLAAFALADHLDQLSSMAFRNENVDRTSVTLHSHVPSLEKHEGPTPIDFFIDIYSIYTSAYQRAGLMSSNLRLTHSSFIDHGGPRRMIFSQLVDLMAKQGVFTLLPSTHPSSRLISRFGWMLDRSVGEWIGFLMAKNCQLGNRLTFTLDPEFFDLATKVSKLNCRLSKIKNILRKDPKKHKSVSREEERSPPSLQTSSGDLAGRAEQVQNEIKALVTEYYLATYASELADYEKNYLMLGNGDDNDGGFHAIATSIGTPRPEDIYFSKLRVPKVSREIGPEPILTRSGLHDDSVPSYFPSIPASENTLVKNLPTKAERRAYFKLVQDRLIEEFDEFVRHLLLGLDQLLHVDLLSYAQIPNVFENMINSRRPSAEMLLEAFYYIDGEILIPSLIPNHDISAKNAFISMVRCFDEALLMQLVGMVSGSPSFQPTTKSIAIVFVPSRSVANRHISSVTIQEQLHSLQPPGQSTDGLTYGSESSTTAQLQTRKECESGIVVGEAGDGSHEEPSDEEITASRRRAKGKGKATGNEIESGLEDEEVSAMVFDPNEGGTSRKDALKQRPGESHILTAESTFFLLLRRIAMEQAKVIGVSLPPDYDPYAMNPQGLTDQHHWPTFSTCAIKIIIPLNHFYCLFLSALNMDLRNIVD